MDIVLRHNDRFRVQTDGGNNFIDIQGMQHEQGIQVRAHSYLQYIEVREKEGVLATFYFRSKRAKKDLDLGWWQDAEVVFAKNGVKHDTEG